MIDYGQFIAAFPEFSDEGAFPQSGIDFWIGQAYASLNTRIMGAQGDLAVMLYVAHNIAMGSRNAAFGASSNPGAVGQTQGPITSKSVGPVSVSYDVNSTLIPGAGPWNATTYGQRLYKLLQTYAAGGLYVPGDAFARARVNPWG